MEEVEKIAARRKTRTVYRYPKRRSYKRNNPMGNVGKGILTGAAVGVINKIVPINIAGADYIIAGYLTKNNLVKELGFITLGRSLAQSFTGGIFGNGLGNGGGFE